MAVEEQAVVGRKGKRSKREERNDDELNSGNLQVEGDKRIFEKEDVMEENKEIIIKKKKKKKELNMDTEDGEILGKKDIKGSGVLSTGGDSEGGMKDVDRKKKKKEKGEWEGDEVLGEGGVTENAQNKKNKKKKNSDGGDNDGEGLKDVDRKKKKKEKGEVLGEGGVAEKAENKKNKKKKKRDGGDNDGGGTKDEDQKKKKKEKREWKGGEVLGEDSVAEKAENKKDKKKKKSDGGDNDAARQDSTTTKATYIGEENAEGVQISGERCDGKITKKIDTKKKKKKKRENEKTNDHLNDVEKTGHNFDGEVNEKVERKKIKREKGRTKNDLKGVEITGEDCNGELIEKVERKKKLKEKKKSMKDLSDVGKDITTNELTFTEGNLCSADNEIHDGDMKTNKKGKRKKTNLEENGSDKPKAKKAKKKVSFSSQVEVFPSEVDSESQKGRGEDGLLRGKRFSPEEDKIVQEAVYKYIKEHALGEKGLEMVLRCKSHREVRDCWNHIALSIPYRPKAAIYYRAQILFGRSVARKWTEEEYDILRKSHELHGNKWKEVAEELQKHRIHVKDTWRRIKFGNRKKGRWSQDEYQTLFDLVNTALQLKLSGEEEKKDKHGMLRDNIPWTAISEKLSTRPDSSCCVKWYEQLTSPMVKEGLWDHADDYRLISKLFTLDASCIEDVDWDNLLDDRSGEICRKRWNQMVLHIGQHGTKPFAEQVDILSKRYCPHLLEVREDWDSKEATV